MVALLVSLLSSLSVGLFIKILKINSVRNLFILVLFNYFIAVVLSLFLLDLDITDIKLSTDSLIIVGLLGFLMPSIFFFLNKSLKTSGLAKTDIFQRLSLIIPVILSFKLFNEVLLIQNCLLLYLLF